jgi:hypothetical protein
MAMTRSRALAQVLVFAGGAAAQEPLVARGELEGLERVAADLARAGQQNAWQTASVCERR